MSNERRKNLGEAVALFAALAAAPLLSGQKCEQQQELHECWEDTATGLCWQDPPRDSSEDTIRLWDATPYCEGLGDGWRVPTIDELRTLVRGCPELETGGECGLTDPGCLGTGCWDGCQPTDYNWGDGPGQYGYYLVAELDPRGGDQVLTSSVDDTSTSENVHELYVDFQSCLINTNAADEYSTVRCVRDEPF